MIEGTALVEGLKTAEKAKSLVTSLLEMKIAHNDKREVKRNDAQKTIMKAINSTRFYLRMFNKGERDFDKEFEIMNYWVDASIAIREVNPKLSADFMFKSDYWADPDNLEAQKKARKLDDILRDITEIVDPERKISPSENEFISLKLND